MNKKRDMEIACPEIKLSQLPTVIKCGIYHNSFKLEIILSQLPTVIESGTWKLPPALLNPQYLLSL